MLASTELGECYQFFDTQFETELWLLPVFNGALIVISPQPNERSFSSHCMSKTLGLATSLKEKAGGGGGAPSHVCACPLPRLYICVNSYGISLKRCILVWESNDS